MADLYKRLKKKLIVRPRSANQPPPRKREESTLLAQIRLAIGARPDVLAARINTGVYAAPGDAAQRIRSAPNGYPDLPLTQLRRVKTRRTVETNFSLYEGPEFWHVYGQSIFVETKAKNGKLSEDQKNFRRAAERVGAIYIAPTSLQEVLDLLGPVPEWVDEWLAAEAKLS